MKKQNSIKLNLGSGHDHRPGWINADIDPATNPDIIIDISQNLPYSNNSIDEIAMQDVLEHFTKEDAPKILTECHRVLKNNGRLHLRIPNVNQIVKQFKSDPPVMMEFLYGTTAHNGVWGAHKYGYTPSMIKTTLALAGFDRIEVANESTNYIIKARKSARKVPAPNILIINQAPDWGGAEEWSSTLVRYWTAQHIPVTTVTNLPKLQAEYTRSGAKVIHLPFILDIIGNWKGMVKAIMIFPYAMFWYTRLLIQQKKQGINVIVMSGFSEKLLITWLARIVGLPCVWFEYGPLTTVFHRNWYLPKILYRITKHLPSSVITISNYTKQNLIEQARISLAKLVLIPPGVKIPSKVNKQSINQTITIGHLSRITKEKNQIELLYAFKKVSKAIPTAKLLIAGHGPGLPELQELIKRLQLEDSVKILGFIKDKALFYRSLDLFVFPGTWEMEGFGIVMAEALSYGVPVVAVDHGPSKEIVRASFGTLCQKDHKHLATAIISELKNRSNQRRTAAAAYAKNHFNATIQAKKVTDYVSQAVVLAQAK